MPDNKDILDKIKKLEEENKRLNDEFANMKKENDTLKTENDGMKKTIGSIETEKQEKVWSNLRDTQIPRGWLVGDKAEETQRAEYTKDPVAYLNKILEHRKANPKEETGTAFTNQGDNPESDDAKMNAILSMQKNIPGRLH